MQKDSKARTIGKTVTWRITATITTMALVLIFTGDISMALEIGLLEWIAKMLFYYLHERGWDKIKWGKTQIPSFVLWISGIPRSGKTTLGNLVYGELQKLELPIQRLDSHDVRPLFPETGFSKNEVDNHIKRVGHLASMLEKNGIISVASFVSPYQESRLFARKQCKNFIEVYLRTTVDQAKKYDDYNLYEKAEKGDLKNFPGVDIPFEESEKSQLVLDMETMDLHQAKDEVMNYLKDKYLRAI